MVFNYLKVKPGQRASATWPNTVVDILNQLYGELREVEVRGTSESPFYELYGYYGYFGELYVQGKRVIKDEDPVNIYDILEPAQEKLREVIPQITVDEYGRIGVVITEPVTIGEHSERAVDQLTQAINKSIIALELEPVSTSASITADENTNGLEVVLEKKGRPFVNIYYSLGGPGELIVDVSIDGSAWRTLHRFTFTEQASNIIVDTGIAYPYIRVRVPTTGIDVVLEVVASR